MQLAFIEICGGMGQSKEVNESEHDTVIGYYGWNTKVALKTKNNRFFVCLFIFFY